MNRREILAAAGAGAALTACAKPPKNSAARADNALSFESKKSLLSGFAVNTEMWWSDLPFEARFDPAARAGFTHVEFWFVGLWKRDAKKLAGIIKDLGLSVSQIVGNAPALATPASRGEFLDNMKAAIEEAQILGSDIVTLTGHQNIDGVNTDDALKSYQDHIAAAAPLFESAKIYAAIEPFNPYDHPGHFINGHSDALRICRGIDSPYVKINWDLFHMQRAEGNVIDNLRKGKDQIGYMQLADSPDRHQPGTGEMDYLNVIAAARAAGYNRPIGLECVPRSKDNDQAVADIVKLAQRLHAVET